MVFPDYAKHDNELKKYLKSSDAPFTATSKRKQRFCNAGAL